MRDYTQLSHATAPLVSVIIPAFNSGPWLAQAIESALCQTYPNVQVVVVNDGSTDSRTHEIASRYLPRVTYIERENGGVAAARNSGITASNGDLIALLDQDDVWLPHKLDMQVRAWKSHPNAALVHSSYHLIDEQGRRISTQGDHDWLPRLREREYRPLPGLLIDMPICSATTLFPRKVLDEVGMFDPTLSGTDDWDLWLRIAAHGHTFYCIGEPLAEYRTHPANTSRNIDLMVGGVLRTLDKFYAQPSIDASALRWRDRAYARRHTWAASLYYGAGDQAQASEHLQAALHYLPKSIATGRFLQSLVHANHQLGGPPPTEAEIHGAALFIRGALAGAEIRPPSRRTLTRRVNTHKKLLLALRTRSPRQMLSAFLSDPILLLDREIWKVLGRRVTRPVNRLRSLVRPGMLNPMPLNNSTNLSPWYKPSAFRYTGVLSLANLEENTSHGKMLAMVPPGSRVLETGCANGRFSRVLVEHGCSVVGVELDPGAASDAAHFCEQVVVGNLEDPAVQAQVPRGFDLILFGDVLEHLAEPWKILRALRTRLKPEGAIVVSIPNVAHWDVRMGLLRGRFDYQDEGVLDSTHLRFFTRRTFLEMLEQTGYSVTQTDAVTRLPLWVYKIRLVRRFAPKLLLPLLVRTAPNLFTLQFVVKAVPR